MADGGVYARTGGKWERVGSGGGSGGGIDVESERANQLLQGDGSAGWQPGMALEVVDAVPADDDVNYEIGDVVFVTGPGDGGSGGLPFTDWTPWTPTYTNLSGGTTDLAVYTRTGNLVTCLWKYTLGSTAPGSVLVSHPFDALPGYAGMPIGGSRYTVPGTDTWTGQVLCYVKNAEMTNVIVESGSIKTRPITSTTPFAWKSGDTLQASWTYAVDVNTRSLTDDELIAEQAAWEEMTERMIAYEVERKKALESGRAKLLALGLTEDEVEAMTNG